ncbi:hypothetical protein M406DRAFT_26345, partial [Cryphonectria parasitica EP155]
RAPQILAVAYTFLTISTIATALRIYCRGWVIKAFALDDWLAIVAQILFILFISYEVGGVHYGNGRHFADIEPGDIPKAMQMWWTCEPLYVLTNMAIKASIAIFLLRICVSKWHKWIIYVVIGVTELYSFAFFLLFLLQCRPLSYFWLRYSADPPAGGWCWSAPIIPKTFYGYSAISCWTDWTFSLLPVALVWNLQMERKVKISVMLILAAGAIASSATIVRFPYLYTLTDVDDFLYSTTDIAIWSAVETGLGITAAGFATLRPLLRRFFGGGGSSAPGHGSSAHQWRRTGSGHIKGSANADTFTLHDMSGKQRYGVTTVVHYG